MIWHPKSFQQNSFFKYMVHCNKSSKSIRPYNETKSEQDWLVRKVFRNSLHICDEANLILAS